MRPWFVAPLFLALALTLAPVGAQAKGDTSIADSVIKMPLASGVSMDDAVQAMKFRANKLNFKSVGELPLSKQLQAMGQKSGRMDVFEFCDPLTAKHMVDQDINFAAYLPCRISLVQDAHGKAWLIMLNLTPIIDHANLSPALKKEALKVRDTLNSIMQAGAKGDLF